MNNKEAPYNNDFNIIKVLLSFIVILLSIQKYIEKYSEFIIITWIIIIFFSLICFLWGLQQVLISKSRFMLSLKWITAIIIFLSPLILSILIMLDFFSYPNYKNIANFIITIYALAFTTYYSINYLYFKIIVS